MGTRVSPIEEDFTHCFGPIPVEAIDGITLALTDHFLRNGDEDVVTHTVQAYVDEVRAQKRGRGRLFDTMIQHLVRHLEGKPEKRADYEKFALAVKEISRLPEQSR